jgi:signal peptidase
VATATRWLGRLALLCVVGLLLLVATVVVVLPRLTHGAALTVRTGSMRPALPVGSVVVERPVDPADLQVGDIATYQQAPARAVYITHRVAAVDRTAGRPTFTFKGDANRVADPVPVPASAIRGKVWFDVPYLGLLSHGALRSGALLLGVLGLGAYSIFQLSAGRRERLAGAP